MSDAHTTTLFLYGRETCHLCHDMWADLRLFAQQHACRLNVVWQDIEENAELEARYGLRIPVLTSNDEHVICEGRLHPEQLHSFLLTNP